MPFVWTAQRRENGLVEHICEHNLGHPNWYSARRMEDYDIEFFGTWSVHDCDGCCGQDDFPGRRMNDWEIVERLSDYITMYTMHAVDAAEIMEWCSYTYHDLRVNAKPQYQQEEEHQVIIDMNEPGV